MSIRTWLGEYILQTHYSKNSEDSMGGLDSPNPSLDTPVSSLHCIVEYSLGHAHGSLSPSI